MIWLPFSEFSISVVSDGEELGSPLGRMEPPTPPQAWSFPNKNQMVGLDWSNLQSIQLGLSATPSCVSPNSRKLACRLRPCLIWNLDEVRVPSAFCVATPTMTDWESNRFGLGAEHLEPVTQRASELGTKPDMTWFTGTWAPAPHGARPLPVIDLAGILATEITKLGAIKLEIFIGSVMYSICNKAFDWIPNGEFLFLEPKKTLFKGLHHETIFRVQVCSGWRNQCSLSFPGSLVPTPFPINSFYSPELGMWLDMTGEGGRLQGGQLGVGSCLWWTLEGWGPGSSQDPT